MQSLRWDVEGTIFPDAFWSGGSEQSMAAQDIVCEGEPAQNRKDLVTAANCELAQAPIAEAGVDAFARSPTFIDALAVRAVHPPAPGHHAGAVVPVRRIGIRPDAYFWQPGRRP